MRRSLDLSGSRYNKSWAVVSAVMNLRVTQNVINFLTN